MSAAEHTVNLSLEQLYIFVHGDALSHSVVIEGAH